MIYSLESQIPQIDKKFQDWMVEVGLMERRGEKSELERPGKIGRKRFNYELLMEEILGKNWGYIIPRKEVARVMYKVEDVSTVSSLNVTINYYRAVGLLPEDFFTQYKLGISRGVRSVAECRPMCLQALSFLWRSPDNRASQEEVAAFLYGDQVNDLSKLKVRMVIHDLRHYLANNRENMRVQNTDIPQKTWELVW